MFVSGFTIARNVVAADYPVKEAILSILPICDEVVVAVGNSDDETLAFIRSIPSDKIRIIETVWDDNLREGGKVLAVETDKALDAVSPEADWCFYIQADECLHEESIPALKKAMENNKEDQRVEGLLFNYRHFYGSYDYIGDSRRWYRHEIRIVRNDKRIHSYRDAQGFRKAGDKLQVKKVNAYIHHYGWVKHPQLQQQKQLIVQKLWHNDEYIDDKYLSTDSKYVADSGEFSYDDIDSLIRYEGTHPAVMLERINRMNWTFDQDLSRKNFGLKERFLYWLEKQTGWRVGEYKNYKVLK